VWTLRAENEFVPAQLRSSEDPAAHGNMVAEIRALLDAGITGFFSDHPDIAVRARNEWCNQ
jgi:glycerophosphoryl diester phosphodiesterase